MLAVTIFFLLHGKAISHMEKPDRKCWIFLHSSKLAEMKRDIRGKQHKDYSKNHDVQHVTKAREV